MKTISFTALVAFCNLAVAQEAPKIELEQTIHDFGNIAQFEILTGSFKVKNAGNAVLRMQQPSSSCGCAVATLKKDTLSPGETGEVEFTWKIGPSKGSLQRSITVASNDPQTPQLVLTIMANSKQIYDVAPTFLMAKVPAGGRQNNLSINVARADGEPFQIRRVDTSQPWIVARIDPASKAGDGSAQIQVEVQGVGVPRRFNEFVYVYADDKIDIPVATISVFGEIMGELTVSPERLFWSVTDPSDKRRSDLLTRRLTIRASTGKEFELKNAQSSIRELSVELNRMDDGKVYEIVAKLGDLPTKSLLGIITFETSLASNPKVEVPVEISVFQQSQARRFIAPPVEQSGRRQSGRRRAPGHLSRTYSAVASRFNSVRKCIGQALILLVASMGLGLLGNAISPRGLPLRTPPSRSPEQEFIPLEQAKELWSNGTAIFLDAREPVDYCAGHIGNAFNLPGLRFETHFGEVAPILTPESQIVVYCDGAECDLSHRVSERLKQMRFTNVWILSNGWTVWRQAGFPIQECSAN